MTTQTLRRITILLTMAAGALTAQNASNMVAPGTVNYIEGSVSIDGNALNTNQNGHTALQRNQTLSTGKGKAEVLMSPGVFLRVGNNSAIRMVAPELVNPQVEVIRGISMLEVDSKIKDASVTILERNATVSVLKEGLYRFDSDGGRIAVVDGQLKVAENGQSKTIGKGKQIVLDNDPKLKAVGFDRKAKDDLYVWSEIRSGSLADANVSTAQNIYAGYGPYAGNGWYWNSYYSMYSWLPGDGFFYSPFGYPFYSVGYMPFYGGFYGGGYYRGHRDGFAGRRPEGNGFAQRGSVSPHAPTAVHGFSGAPRFSGGGFGGGGFRGAGGGSRGGGGGHGR
jgi:hypothetical protein